MSSLPPDQRHLPEPIRAQLDAASRALPPDDLLDAVVAGVQRSRQVRSWWMLPRLVAAVGSVGVAAVVIAGAVLGLGRGNVGAPQPGYARAERDGFVLELRTEKTSYAPNEPIEVRTTLSYHGRQHPVRFTTSNAMVAFSERTLDGSRVVGPASRESCRLISMEPGGTFLIPFGKSGGWTADDPNAPFLQSFFADPLFRLPAGRWELAAHFFYDLGTNCTADPRDLVATVRVTVGGSATIASSSAGVVSPSSVPASPLASPHLLPVAGWSERVVDRGSKGIQVMGWSPDGSKFAVIGGHDVSASTVQVFDESGRLLRTFPGWIAAWIDNDHLVAAGGFDPPDASTPTWIRSASGSDDRQLDPGAATLVGPSANGSVALLGTTNPATPFGGDVFRVLHGDALGPQMPGYALGWSLDGTKLAYVADVTQFGKVGRGHLQLLDLSTMQSRDLGLIAEEPGTALLNADGSRLVTCIAATTEASVCHLAMVDTESGSVLTDSTMTSGSGVWASPDTVLLSNGQTLYRWTVGSAPVASAWQPPTNTPGIAGIGRGGLAEVILLPEGPEQASHPVTDSVVDRELIIVSAGQYAPHLANYLEMSPAGHRALFVRASASGVDQLILATVPG